MGNRVKSRPTGQAAVLSLDSEQQQQIQSLCRSNHRVTADRARVILALARGDNSIQVAQQLGLHPVAVRRIKKHFLQAGVDALRARHSSGRPAHKRALVEDTLSSLSVCDRLQCPEQGVLSAAAIAALIQQRHGVKVCINTVRSALKKGAFDIAELDTV